MLLNHNLHKLYIFLQVFSDCTECTNSTSLMCWPHTYCNLVPNLKHLGSIDKHLSAKLLADIEDLQWSALSESVFKHAYELLEMKYFNEFEKNSTILPALKEFFQYMRKVWIESAKTNGLKEHMHSDHPIIKELKVAIGKSKLLTPSEKECRLVHS